MLVRSWWDSGGIIAELAGRLSFRFRTMRHCPSWRPGFDTAVRYIDDDPGSSAAAATNLDVYTENEFKRLPAGSDLSSHIRSAIAASEFLIVVCSPAARESPGVNLEISDFRARHGGAKLVPNIGQQFRASIDFSQSR
jgi:hypothetical protein